MTAYYVLIIVCIYTLLGIIGTTLTLFNWEDDGDSQKMLIVTLSISITGIIGIVFQAHSL